MRLISQLRSPSSALAVLVLLVLGVNLVGCSGANPYAITGEVPPDQETYPPVIAISSPVNNTAYNTSRVPLTFNVTAPQSRTRLIFNGNKGHLRSRLEQRAYQCSQWRPRAGSAFQSLALKRA